MDFLEPEKLLPAHQSAYRKNHSTETAILKIASDSLMAADVGQVTLLGLLDLWTRWITTSSSIDFAFHLAFVVELLAGLTHSFAREHKWSITMVRHQRRQMSNAMYHKEVYWFQFYFYCTRLTCLTFCNKQHGLSSHTYADDTQLYAHCRAQSCQKTAVKVTECIKDIDRWMSSNRLKLKGDKTPSGLAS